MSSDAAKQGWFDEFKKVNASAHAPAVSTSAGRVERRHHPRFSLHDATIRLYRRGATSVFGLARLSIEGVVLELSEGGLRLEAGERFMLDTKVHLKITVAKFNDTVESDGVTRWCHSIPKKPDHFQVGVQFVNLDAAAARKIAQMKGWYTSAQYQVLLAQHLREQKRI